MINLYKIIYRYETSVEVPLPSATTQNLIGDGHEMPGNDVKPREKQGGNKENILSNDMIWTKKLVDDGIRGR